MQGGLKLFCSSVNIHGIGVYAVEDIPLWTLVWHFYSFVIVSRIGAIMIEKERKEMCSRKRSGRFEHHLRSCTICGSANGLEIFSHHQKNDIIFCEVCGVKYSLQSIEPVRLRCLEPQAAHDAAWVEKYSSY